jgi:hypothetical protein
MTTRFRMAFAGAVFTTAFALILMAGPSQAGGEKDLKAVVQKIADAIKKDDKEAAKKLAAAAVKDKALVGPINDIMRLFKPRNKGGLGVGAKPLANPAKDGIEVVLRELRKEVTAASLKQADALETTGYWIAALAELSLAKGWAENVTATRTPKAWAEHSEEMRSLGVAFAKAAASKKALDIKGAADKLNMNCNRCHSTFKNDL